MDDGLQPAIRQALQMRAGTVAAVCPDLLTAQAEALAHPANVHLFINANIDKDGGAQNIFDPGNGYKDQYKKIWGVM